MAKRHTLCALLSLMAVLFVLPPQLCHADLAPPGPFEQITTMTLPAVYNELVAAYLERVKDSPDTAIKDFSSKLDFYVKTLGRVMAVLDVGGKIYAGDNKEAAISAGLTVLGELAGSKLGSAYLSAAGLTTAPVTALITAVQVYRMSEAELEKANIAVTLERLYGTIEADPVLKNRDRALGVGDPIPVTAEAVEYTWRKVLLNNGWRNMFKVYVTDQLGKKWPEASWWQNWTTPDNRIEDAAMLENMGEYKGYIAGLLSSLNSLAKRREQSVLINKHMKSLQQRFQNLSIGSLLEQYAQAVKNLPKVEAFVKQCPELIARGLQDRSLGPLNIVISSSRDHARNTLAYIPNSGTIGQKRDELLEALKAHYQNAWSARIAVNKSLDLADRQMAQQQRVSTWRAQQIGFDLSFEDLEASARNEFELDGAIPKTAKKLDEAWAKVRSGYEKQGQEVTDDYRERTRNNENLESELKAFSRQLDAYFSIDQRQYVETSARLNALLATLEEQVVLRDQALDDQRALLGKQRDRLRPVFNNLKELRRTYHLTDQMPPVSNYVGLVKFTLPEHPLPQVDQDVYSFTAPYFDDLNKLQQQVSAARHLTMADGVSYDLPTLISVMGQLDQYVVDLLAEQEAFSSFSAAVQEFEQQLSAVQGPTSWSIKRAWAQLETDLKPFVAENAGVMQEAENLQGIAGKSRQNYTTDLENIEKDQDYLHQLSATLGRMSAILKTLVARYQQRRLAHPMEDGYILFHPDRAGTNQGASCDQLNKEPVLMSAEELAEVRSNLTRHLADAGLLWLEDHYQVKVRAFADQYFTRRALLDKLKTPVHYSFIPGFSLDPCTLIYPTYFDALAKSIAAIERVDSYFTRELEKAIGANGLSNFDNVKMLGIPRKEKTREDPSVLDIANLPEDHFDVLRRLANSTWDKETSSSIGHLIEVFNDKLNAHYDWQAKEAYFDTVLSRCGTVASPLENLEFSARNAYDAGETDQALAEYERAAAMRQPVIGCYAAAGRDSKLSASRQEYLAAYVPRYEKQFYFIDEMVRNLRLTQTARQQGAAAEENGERVRSFYQKFQEAYQSKNESAVMALVDDQWSSADGTTLFDLEDNLHNVYNVFDDIQYRISDLTMQDKGGGVWQVSYRVSITGMIFENNLTHEEESQVTEQLSIGDAGRVTIIKTLAGQYWSIQ